MTRTTMTFATMSIAFMGAPTATADTLLVPLEYSTLLQAVLVSEDGDEIVIADGTYEHGFFNISFGGKAITIRSENGPEACIIDAEVASIATDTGFLFQNGEGPDSTLKGLTLRNTSPAIIADGASPTIQDCVFECGDPAVQLIDSSPLFIDTVFDGTGCTGSRRGVEATGSGAPVFINCQFINRGNTVAVGGAIHADCNSVMLINTLIRDCWSEGAGGGGSTPPGRGGGLYVTNDSSGTVINCTIADCWAASGSSSSGLGGGILASGPTTIINSILSDNSPSQVSGVGANVMYSLVEGGWPGEGNIDDDPMFKNVEDGDYRLLPDSPAIDAGISALLPADEFDLDDDGDVRETIPYDYDGLDRIVGRSVDMGAFEYQGPDAADFDVDGVVGPADLAQLLGVWGPCADPRDCSEDLNGDGTVGPADLALLLGSWG